jgi:hypothetical protein
MPVIPALGRQRKEYCKLEASLGWRVRKKKNQEMIEERGSGRIVFVHLAELPLWALGFI